MNNPKGGGSHGVVFLKLRSGTVASPVDQALPMIREQGSADYVRLAMSKTRAVWTAVRSETQSNSEPDRHHMKRSQRTCFKGAGSHEVIHVSGFPLGRAIHGPIPV